MSAAQWAFWLAVAALIAASGKFLDEYHIKASTRSKVRDVLIEWFVWLDARSVPDLGGVILRALRALFQIRRLVLVALGLAFSYWATLSAFYFGREIFGPPNLQSYGNYLLTWIPLDWSAPFWLAFLASIIVPAMLGLVAMAYFFHRASLSDSDIRRLSLLAAGLVSGIALAWVGAMLPLIAFSGGGYFFEVIVLGGLASVAVPMLLVVLTMLLILVRYGIKLARFLLLNIFDVASSPTVSPFTYASALLSVIILVVKVGQAAVAG